MENNEIMNEGIENAMEEIVVNEGTGINPGAVVLGVAGVALAVFAGVKLAKKAYAAFKAKKEHREPDVEVANETEDVEDVVAE